MSTYLDLETDRYHDDDEGREFVDWMTIKTNHGFVSFNRETLSAFSGLRRVDPSAGISFRAEHLDAVIDALVRVRTDLGMVPSSEEKTK